MTTNEILVSIDAEIARLKEVRALLSNGVVTAKTDAAPAPQRHKMSAAGRKKIAAAQRKRWAAQKAKAAK
jgi:hypothetical protein